MGKRKEAKDAEGALSRRERQIMEVVYGAGRAVTARDVHGAMEDAPSYSTVRTLLGILEEKGEVVHREEGRAYVYEAKKGTEEVGGPALARVVRTFFGGSVQEAMAGLLTLDDTKLSRDDLERIAAMIKEKQDDE